MTHNDNIYNQGHTYLNGIGDDPKNIANLISQGAGIAQSGLGLIKSHQEEKTSRLNSDAKARTQRILIYSGIGVVVIGLFGFMIYEMKH